MKAILLLTTGLQPARELLADWRRRHPEAAWTVVLRDEHRRPLADDLRDCEVLRDKPAGGKLAFLRDLRRRRFDLLVVAWRGDGPFQPMRLAALVLGARRALAIDERGRTIPLRLLLPIAMLRHGVRRLAALQVRAVAQMVCTAYRATLGGLLGSAWLAAGWLWAVWRRPRRRNPAAGAVAPGHLPR